MIYFAQLPTGAIKIGCSGDVPDRLRHLEQLYKQPLALLHVMEGDRKTEREIHDRFAHLRFNRKEQFRPGADLMEFVGKPLLVTANPDAVESVAVSTEKKAIRLELPSADYKRLERQAIRLDRSLSYVARKAVMEWVKAREAEGGGAK